jgi:hypothetical protein
MSLLQTADVERILSELSRERPVFHSEADFQFELASKMRQKCPHLMFRLEMPVVTKGRPRVDIFAFCEGSVLFLELKYLPRYLRAQVQIAEGKYEAYDLRDQAREWGRYDFLKDITRLETWVAECTRRCPEAVGYAILLTNDQNYWNKLNDKNAKDYAFQLHDNRTIAGGEVLTWGERATASDVKGRKHPIVLCWSYTFQWRDYSELAPPLAKPVGRSKMKHTKFRYLLVRVPPSG